MKKDFSEHTYKLRLEKMTKVRDDFARGLKEILTLLDCDSPRIDRIVQAKDGALLHLKQTADDFDFVKDVALVLKERDRILDQLNVKAEQLKGEIEKLTAKASNLEEEAKQKDGHINQLASEVARLENERTASQKISEEIGTQNHKLSNELELLGSRYQAAMLQIEQLKFSQEMANGLEKGLLDSQGQVEALQAELKAAKEELKKRPKRRAKPTKKLLPPMDGDQLTSRKKREF
jgi:chromosome segregation ATPase